MAKSPWPCLAVEVVPKTGSPRVPQLLLQHFYIYPVTIILMMHKHPCGSQGVIHFLKQTETSLQDGSFPWQCLSLRGCAEASLPGRGAQSSRAACCRLQVLHTPRKLLPDHRQVLPFWRAVRSQMEPPCLLHSQLVSVGGFQTMSLVKSLLEVAASPHALHTASRQLTCRSDCPKEF